MSVPQTSSRRSETVRRPCRTCPKLRGSTCQPAMVLTVRGKYHHMRGPIDSGLVSSRELNQARAAEPSPTLTCLVTDVANWRCTVYNTVPFGTTNKVHLTQDVSWKVPGSSRQLPRKAGWLSRKSRACRSSVFLPTALLSQPFASGLNNHIRPSATA